MDDVAETLAEEPKSSGDSKAPEALVYAKYLAFATDMRTRWARGDVDSVLELFDDRAVYRLLGSRALIPSAGVRLGKQEIREAWRAFYTDFEVIDFHIDDLAYHFPHTTFTAWRLCLRHRGTQARANLECCDHVMWSNGKIVKMTSFFDTALLAALTPYEDPESRG